MHAVPRGCVEPAEPTPHGCSGALLRKAAACGDLLQDSRLVLRGARRLLASVPADGIVEHIEQGVR
eukprot:16431998-Heterocapsa_arctica.AAC.1